MVRKVVVGVLAILVLATVGGGVALVALGGGPPSAAGPRSVHLGEEECANCHMIVSEAPFAAERVLGVDDVRVYDDPGCLLLELPKDRRGAIYFADAVTGEWIPGASVRFEPSARPTPMGYALAATTAAKASPRALDLESAVQKLANPAKEKR